MLASLRKKETYKDITEKLRFALYCSTHPLDGFWDLTHEKRGSIAAANIILVLTLITNICKLQYTSFLFMRVYWPEENILIHLASVLFPLALWCVGNWALTTLFDGKGRLNQIYMATCYAMTPYPLIQFPLIILSNMITVEEGSFYNVLSILSILWTAMLIVAAMMQIHEYSLSKTILFTIATIFAMLVMVFILLIFFSMISQGVSYFVSIIREILYRM
ncbi:MAG: Yip1 domain-containing protein [Lachnoclostridium sp.]